MRARIVAAFDMVKGKPEIQPPVRENLLKQCRKCIEVVSSHVEQNLRVTREERVDVVIQ